MDFESVKGELVPFLQTANVIYDEVEIILFCKETAFVKNFGRFPFPRRCVETKQFLYDVLGFVVQSNVFQKEGVIARLVIDRTLFFYPTQKPLHEFDGFSPIAGIVIVPIVKPTRQLVADALVAKLLRGAYSGILIRLKQLWKEFFAK